MNRKNRDMRSFRLKPGCARTRSNSSRTASGRIWIASIGFRIPSVFNPVQMYNTPLQPLSTWFFGCSRPLYKYANHPGIDSGRPRLERQRLRPLEGKGEWLARWVLRNRLDQDRATSERRGIYGRPGRSRWTRYDRQHDPLPGRQIQTLPRSSVLRHAIVTASG